MKTRLCKLTPVTSLDARSRNQFFTVLAHHCLRHHINDQRSGLVAELNRITTTTAPCRAPPPQRSGTRWRAARRTSGTPRPAGTKTPRGPSCWPRTPEAPRTSASAARRGPAGAGARPHGGRNLRDLGGKGQIQVSTPFY